MNTLGGIDIGDLRQESPFAFTGVRAVVTETLGGSPVIWEGAYTGQGMDLVGDSSGGWLSKVALTSLLSLASVPGGVYVLSLNGVSYDVRFRNEDYPAIEHEQVFPLADDESDDPYYNIRIKLMVV